MERFGYIFFLIKNVKSVIRSFEATLFPGCMLTHESSGTFERSQSTNYYYYLFIYLFLIYLFIICTGRTLTLLTILILYLHTYTLHCSYLQYLYKQAGQTLTLLTILAL